MTSKIFSKIFGICVTNTWKVCTHHLPNTSKDKYITVKRYANILVLSLLNNHYYEDLYLYILPTVQDEDQLSELDCPSNTELISCITYNTLHASQSSQSSVHHEQAI